MTIDHVHALPPGTRFEEYRLDAVLGAGGFGITYRAYDANLDKFVAIKEYLPGEFAVRTERTTVVPKSSTDVQDYQWGLSRFLDEARTLARFDHSHLNKVYRFFEANGTAYMVLEYIRGETLADRLSREPNSEEDALQRLLEEVLSGLAIIHEAGYVHRDIKPGNLMLREEDGSAVLLDFGAARQAVGQRSKPITSILTPGYAPVEQYDGKVDRVGAWTDIYALGMVAYRCISGLGDGELTDAVARMLAQSRGDVGLLPAIESGKGKYSPKLLKAIDWAMEVDEHDRPQSVEAWRQALAGAGRKKRTAKPARKPATRPAKAPTTERTGMSWSSLALTAVIVVLLGASAWQGWRLYQGMPNVGVDETETTVESQADTRDEPERDSSVGSEPQTVDMVSSTDSTKPEAAPPASEPDKSPPVEQDEVTRLLAAAEADITARRLTRPMGNNAWDRYLQVLELEPANEDAIKGMERVIGSYMALFGAALAQEDFDKAAGYLASIRDLNPDSPVLDEGERRLEVASQARTDRLAELERQRQAEDAARQADLARQRLEQAVRERLASFETALQRDELERAADYLGQVRDLNPAVPGLAAGETRLAQAREAARKKALQYVGEMVSIPGGTFRMGDMSGEGGDAEKPVHSVTVPAFSMGRHEVTFTQWDACVADGGCGRYTPDDEGWGRGNRPVINVSWDDIKLFIKWLNSRTGESYRLPSEAEWEYAVRAGSSTKYHFGNDESQLCRYGNHADSGTDFGWKNESCSDGVGKRTAEVGRYQPNSFGLYDMHGNVWEWVEDCWNGNYAGAPSDGRAWTQGDCGQRVVRGGSWADAPWYLRSATRVRGPRSNRFDNLGFRLVQDK